MWRRVRVSLTNLLPDELLSPLIVPQRPRVLHEPEGIVSTALGEDGVALAAHAGLVLDDWQAADLTLMLSERADGLWACQDFGHVVARQNGKGSTLEARELVGLFLTGERLILHSAHLASTSADAFNRLLGLIENTPDLERKIKRVSRSTQDMSIETKQGCRVLFKTRTKGGGRGLSGDCVILDESLYLYWPQMAALMPTLSARPNPQIIYASSAGESESEVLHALRRRALEGNDPSLGYCEYSAEPDDDPAAFGTWAKANPALLTRISLGYVAKERETLTAPTFGRERLTLFDDDLSAAASFAVVSAELWAAGGDVGSQIVSQVALAVEVNKDRSRAAIGVAGRNAAGKFHVEVVDLRDGTDWVVDRVCQIGRAHDVGSFAVDAGGPAGFLIPSLIEAGVDVHPVSPREAAQACGMFATSAKAGGLAHLDQGDLNAAVEIASKRDSGDVWFWRRNGDDESIQLIACTLALGRVPSLAEELVVPGPSYAY